VKVEVEKPGVNVIDAASRGASDGLQLALNIGAMLIAFHRADRSREWDSQRDAFTHRLDSELHAIDSRRIFSPIAWLLGVKYNDCATIGNLLGERLILK